jgi:beta-glucanase (GH16 family)
MRRRRLAPGAAIISILAAVLALGVGSYARASAAHLAATPGATQARGRLEFSAGFRGRKLDTKVWSTCYPAMDGPSGCTNFDGHEYEWYLPSQARVYDGLSLVAQRIRTRGFADTGKPEIYGCRSGMITTYKSFRFRYGFLQVVAEIPHSTGLWPALWLASANGALVPEIDMVESWGTDARTMAYFHPAPLPPPGHRLIRGVIPLDLTTGWQTYSLSWTKSQLTYYVGSHVVLVVRKDVPHQAMYFLADLAEYVKPAAGNCNGRLQIKSVKVWSS